MDVDYLASLVHGCTNFFALTKARLFRELSGVSDDPYEFNDMHLCMTQ